MKKKYWIIFGRIALSFIVLFLFYTIHFILVRTQFNQFLKGWNLEVVKLCSIFLWSFLGGLMTIKISNKAKSLSLLAVSFLTFAYLMLNYPSSLDGIVLFWLSTMFMVVGVFIGGFFQLKKEKYTGIHVYSIFILNKKLDYI